MRVPLPAIGNIPKNTPQMQQGYPLHHIWQTQGLQDESGLGHFTPALLHTMPSGSTRQQHKVRRVHGDVWDRGGTLEF